MVANQIRPPGFPPHQNNQNNFNRGNNFNQNRSVKFNQSNFNQGGNFNQGHLLRPQVNQPPAYQAPIPQTQSVSKTDFESYVKANDAVLRNMQNQGQNLQIQMANLTDMLSKFMCSNTASSSGSGTLPSNTITNPKEDLKGITTRSGVAYQGPTIPTPSKVVKQGTETGRALIDVHKGELTLHIRNEAITYNLDQTSRYSANYNQTTANKIDVICEVYSQEVLGFLDITTSGNPTPYDDPIVSIMSPTLTLFGDSDFLLFEEASAFLGLEDDPNSPEFNPFYYDLEGDILLLEAILNSKPLSPLPNHEQYLPSFKKELKVCEAKTVKSSVVEPPEVKLKDLPPHLEYAFLEGDNKFPVIIFKELGDEEKSALIKVLKSHKRKQRSPILTERLPIDACLSVCAMHRGRFKGEKSHFMVKEGIVLGHKISKNGIEVDRAKVDVIAKLPHPTTVKGIQSFLSHAGFYRRFIQDFSKISRPMTHLLEKNTLFIFSEDCIKAFQTLKKKLTEAPILIAPNWDLPFELMCDASDFAIGAVLGQCYEKHFRPIHYASKTMNDAESNYTTTKKEMLAVVYAFKKFQSYLIMNKSIVHTDHSALKYLFAKKRCQGEIALALKQANFDLAVAGDHRKVQLNELNELCDHAYENSLIYKEKTKRIHDSKIKNRVFNVHDRVLLFNSRLKIFSGKLKTHWSGPFTIANVFPYGTVELSQANGHNFKVNGHRVKHYFGGDVPQCVSLRSPNFPHEPMNTGNWVKLSDLKQALRGRQPMFIHSNSM
nr:reverse transcriptase domain-containing protein [Tanacetum cinerariifolium]